MIGDLMVFFHIESVFIRGFVTAKVSAGDAGRQ